MLIASGGIGDDLLFSLVVDRFLTFAEPGEPVFLLIRRDAAGAAFSFPASVTTETYEWRKFRRHLLYRWRTCKRLRDKNLRLVISTDYDRHPLVDEMIIAACRTDAWAAKARRSRKWDAQLAWNERFFTRLVDVPPAHRLTFWSDLADRLSGHETRTGLNRFAFGKERIGRENIVVLHTFASDRRRELPPEIYEPILSVIPSHYELRLSCAPQDLRSRPRWREFAAKHSLVVDSSSIPTMFDLLQRCAALISIDTSLVHLGALAGTPTFCLCGDAYRGFTVPYEAPWAPGHVQFYMARCEHNGCLGSCIYPLENGAFRCVNRLPLQQLIDDLGARLQ